MSIGSEDPRELEAALAPPLLGSRVMNRRGHHAKVNGVAALVCVALLCSPLLVSEAKADVDSTVTLGIGAELGLNHHSQVQADAENSFVSEITVRLRLFRFLGASFAYNVNPIKSSGELIYDSTFRVSVLIYMLPLERFSIYVQGGYGAINVADLGTLTGATNSYHAGAGLEVYLGDHWALHADYNWIIPGASSIRGAIERRTTNTRAAIEAAEDEEAIEAAMSEVESLSVTDYLSGSNFQLTIGVRFYI